MRIAVISDIHANLEALEAVLGSIAKSACDKIFCLGDVVGYGPNPHECIKMLAQAHIPTVKGNHDAACASNELPYSMNSIAMAAVVWTQEQLSGAEKLWLNNLQHAIVVGDSTFTHASPACVTDDWDYITTLWEAENAFSHLKGRICFIGHTHEPVAWIERDREVDSETFDRLHLEQNKRYIVNVGSVGQPRDRDPRAAYVIYDSDKGFFEMKRVNYDLQKTQAKILKAGLPAALADRLQHGW